MDFFGGGDDPFGGGAPGLFAQFAQGFGAGNILQRHRRPPRDYDEYLKAYSVAMLPGNERTNLSYGGKVILPQSALARLTSLDLEPPWMFKLSNPANPAASTHAGVLEFIAEEGVVHLPYWMMKTLRLNEGDPIRIIGAELPKGKLVKFQAQSVHFLELVDHRAVLEQALRHFSSLTQGDIIEISYNSIVFELLVMETTPGGSGINILDTDLEVDFAAPKGYVEPERPKAAPPPTMASKLKIDLNSSTPGSSRPSSALSFAAGATHVVSRGGEDWESFKGKGETLSGRRTKGKGISQRKVEDQMEGSSIWRTDKKKLISTDMLEAESNAPAPLNLPFGKLFFGYRVIPYTKPAEANAVNGATNHELPPSSFSGSGNVLTGRSSTKGKEKEVSRPTPTTSAPSPPANNPFKGSGHSLRSGGGGAGATTSGPAAKRSPQGPVAYGAGGARAPRQPARQTTGKGNQKQQQRSPTPDWGVDEDDDVMMVDSD